MKAVTHKVLFALYMKVNDRAVNNWLIALKGLWDSFFCQSSQG